MLQASPHPSNRSRVAAAIVVLTIAGWLWQSFSSVRSTHVHLSHDRTVVHQHGLVAGPHQHPHGDASSSTTLLSKTSRAVVEADGAAPRNQPSPTALAPTTGKQPREQQAAQRDAPGDERQKHLHRHFGGHLHSHDEVPRESTGVGPAIADLGAEHPVSRDAAASARDVAAASQVSSASGKPAEQADRRPVPAAPDELPEDPLSETVTLALASITVAALPQAPVMVTEFALVRALSLAELSQAPRAGPPSPYRARPPPWRFLDLQRGYRQFV